MLVVVTKYELDWAIKNNEPRVTIDNINVSADVDNNAYNVTLQYTILNRDLPVTTTMFLERIR